MRIKGGQGIKCPMRTILKENDGRNWSVVRHVDRNGGQRDLKRMKPKRPDTFFLPPATFPPSFSFSVRPISTCTPVLVTRLTLYSWDTHRQWHRARAYLGSNSVVGVCNWLVIAGATSSWKNSSPVLSAAIHSLLLLKFNAAASVIVYNASNIGFHAKLRMEIRPVQVVDLLSSLVNGRKTNRCRLSLMIYRPFVQMLLVAYVHPSASASGKFDRNSNIWCQ